jgi:hypothetical protein
MGYKSVGAMTRVSDRLTVQCVQRAWQQYVHQEIVMREKVAMVRLKAKSKDTQDFLTMIVMTKALDDHMEMALPMILHLWAKITRNEKDMAHMLTLSTKADNYMTMHQRDVGHIMLISMLDREDLRLQIAFRAFIKATMESRDTRYLAEIEAKKKRHKEAQDFATAMVMSKVMEGNMAMAIPVIWHYWVKLVDASKFLRGELQQRARADKFRRKYNRSVARMMYISLIDQQRLWLQAAFRAFDRVVAEARDARGEDRLTQLRSMMRSRHLPLGEKLVRANEARERTQALMSWKLKLSDDQKDAFASKYKESLSEREDFARNAEALKERLGMQLLISEHHSDDAIIDSDSLKVCTGELWGEAHKQGLLLESLEHEMILLEAQFSTAKVKA